MSKPDSCYRVFGDNSSPIVLPDGSRFCPSDEGLDPLAYADVLKLSHARGFTARHFTVQGGYENAIDANRMCSDVYLEDGTIEGGWQSGFVIKGGTQGFTTNRLAFTKVRGWCEYLIGDWSDQSFDKTTGVVIRENTRDDGKPVRVVVGRGDWPKIEGGNVRICYVLSYLLKAYWWLKWSTRKLHLNFLMP